MPREPDIRVCEGKGTSLSGKVMIQPLHLARENDARKRELARIQEEADLLRHLLCLVLQFRAKSTIDTGVRCVVPDTAPES
jgi:hypothetical protein